MKTNIQPPNAERRHLWRAIQSDRPAHRVPEAKKMIVMVTAYDFPTGALPPTAAGVDIVLVGDSLKATWSWAMTPPCPSPWRRCCTTRARRAAGCKSAMLVADIALSVLSSFRRRGRRNAGRFVQEAGAEAVKVEGGRKRLPVIQALLDAEIPSWSTWA